MAQILLEQSKILQKRDKTLIITVAIIAGVLFLAVCFLQREEGVKVRITMDGNIYGEYALSKEQVIDIHGAQGYNQLVIAEGSAYIAEADCPDKYCMEYSPISKQNEVIVCLPHKLVLEVVGQGGESADVLVYYTEER